MRVDRVGDCRAVGRDVWRSPGGFRRNQGTVPGPHAIHLHNLRYGRQRCGGIRKSHAGPAIQQPSHSHKPARSGCPKNRAKHHCARAGQCPVAVCRNHRLYCSNPGRTQSIQEDFVVGPSPRASRFPALQSRSTTQSPRQCFPSVVEFTAQGYAPFRTGRPESDIRPSIPEPELLFHAGHRSPPPP